MEEKNGIPADAYDGINRLLFFPLAEDSPVRRIYEAYRVAKQNQTPLDETVCTAAAREILFSNYRKGLEGDTPWNLYLTEHLVTSENPFSLSCEVRRGKEPDALYYELALSDAAIYRELYSLTFTGSDGTPDEEGLSYQKPQCLSALTHIGGGSDGGHAAYAHSIRRAIGELSYALANAKDEETFLDDHLIPFFATYGVGMLGLHKAFRLKENGEITAINSIKHVAFYDLVGLESQKQKLIENTEAFLQGRPANNVLLYGDAGTGKSTSIKALINRYYPDGLRMIEIYKHEFKHLNRVIAQIKNRNYRFIIYMDDLSFDDFETEYKYLKAVIEGGLEKKPDNVLIYATSNRRHIIRESMQDNREIYDLHRSDSKQEKLSLSARFGVTIYYGSPDKKEYENIVLSLKEKEAITMPDDELLLLANQWEMQHSGRSGRTAQQFIDHILGTMMD